MSYLERLKETCSHMQEVSNTKEEIDTAAQLQETVNGLEAEVGQILKNQDELKAAYKEAILHNSFGDKKPVDPVTDTKSVDFNEFLNQFINKK